MKKLETIRCIIQGEISKPGLGVGLALGWHLDETALEKVVKALERGRDEA